jgi:ANTAR domain
MMEWVRVNDEITSTGDTELAELVDRLTEERDQLAYALETRIVIEQAKGVLAERYGLSVGDSFLLLRQSARSAQMKIHLLAEQVVTSPTSPQAIVRGLARDSRWRAAAMRERNEATAERARSLHLAHLEQRERTSRR